MKVLFITTNHHKFPNLLMMLY